MNSSKSLGAVGQSTAPVVYLTDVLCESIERQKLLTESFRLLHTRVGRAAGAHTLTMNIMSSSSSGSLATAGSSRRCVAACNAYASVSRSFISYTFSSIFKSYSSLTTMLNIQCVHAHIQRVRYSPRLGLVAQVFDVSHIRRAY